MKKENTFDSILKKPTRIMVVLYCVNELCFYFYFYPGNYFVWICRAVAGAVMVSLVFILTGIKKLTNRQLSIIVPCSLAVVEIITCLIVTVDKQLNIFLIGTVLLSLTYIDITGLLVTIIFTCTTYAVITMGLRIPQIGVEFNFEYDLSSVISLIIIDILIFLIGRYSIRELVRSRRTGQTFDSILETTPNFIAIVNDKAKVEYISKSLAEMLRIENRENAINKPFTDLFPTDELKDFFGKFMQHEGRIEDTFDFQISGERRWFILRSAAIGESKIARVFDCVDITHILELQHDAEAATLSKSKFLAMVSHEIRTPMNAIIGITQIELQKAGLPDEYADAFDIIYNSATNLLGIINEILDISKIETGKLEINPVKYNTASLINDTVQLNIVNIGSKQINFILDIDENLPSRLYGDDLRIKQILNNLLSNAIKYTEKGYVKLSASYTAEDGDVMLRFAVEDTGQGLKPESKDSLFLEYSRFNSEANRSTMGTGLGLYITKQLAGLMGGDILVESEYGKGSVFTAIIRQKVVDYTAIGPNLADNLMRFKFLSQAVSNTAQIAREYMPYGSVLIVDDVASNLFVARGLMIPYGLQIETAKSGAEAIKKIKSGGVYDIVFMDHMMPVIDGIETVKIIRDMGYANTIVALTANAIVGQSVIFLTNGFDGFISKPIDSRELDAMLNRFIRDKQPPEVIEAARREQRKREMEKHAGPDKEINDTSEITKYFIKDAENAIEVMEDAYIKMQASDTKAFYSYNIAVHGMKNALANIGELELSGIAYKLEQAVYERNLGVIMEYNPAFIVALRFLIEKYTPAYNDETAEITEDDSVYLKNKLREIKTACHVLDITAAKGALEDLRQKTWPRHITVVLDEISVHLLHSAFRKAEVAAEI